MAEFGDIVPRLIEGLVARRKAWPDDAYGAGYVMVTSFDDNMGPMTALFFLGQDQLPNKTGPVTSLSSHPLHASDYLAKDWYVSNPPSYASVLFLGAHIDPPQPTEPTLKITANPAT